MTGINSPHPHEQRPSLTTHNSSLITHNSSPGFTLIELLVSMAIMSIILAGLAAVFVGSMKAVRVGYQTMDAYEMSRGSFQVLQRDLSTSFTSRDQGQYYSFFGTPYGMTFVGSASNYRGTQTNQGANLARVTYVLRQFESKYIDSNAAVSPIDQVVRERDHITTKRSDANGNTISDKQRVFVLIRYIEQGISDLDTFPGIDWSGGSYVNDPEFGNNTGQNLAREVAKVATDYAGQKPAAIEALTSARKRELWIRMLRGNGPVYNPATNAWEPLPVSQVMPDFFDRNPFDTLNPYDPLDPNNDKNEFTGALKPYLRDFVVATNIIPELDDSPVTLMGVWAFEYMSDSFALNPVANPNAPLSLEVQYSPLRPRYWNSDHNANYLIPSVNNPPAEGGIGSPLIPRLPVSVRVRLPLVFPAAHVGAPDMRRLMDETIDLPTAFTRPPTNFG